MLSCIPVPIHIDESCPKTYVSPDLIESTVGLMMKLYEVAMGSVTERSVC